MAMPGPVIVPNTPPPPARRVIAPPFRRDPRRLALRLDSRSDVKSDQDLWLDEHLPRRRARRGFGLFLAGLAAFTLGALFWLHDAVTRPLTRPEIVTAVAVARGDRTPTPRPAPPPAIRTARTAPLSQAATSGAIPVRTLVVRPAPADAASAGARPDTPVPLPRPRPRP